MEKVIGYMAGNLFILFMSITLTDVFRTLPEEKVQEIVKDMWKRVLTTNNKNLPRDSEGALFGEVDNKPILDYLVELTWCPAERTTWQRQQQLSETEEFIWSMLALNSWKLPQGDSIYRRIGQLRDYRAKRVADIIDKLELPEEANIASIGVGSGGNMIEVTRRHPRYKISGVDPATKPGYPANELLESQQYTHFRDISAMEDGSCDMIIIGWVLHHADKKDHQKILETARSKLKKDGVLLFLETVPTYDVDYVKPVTQKWEPTPAECEAYLRDAISSTRFFETSAAEVSRHGMPILDVSIPDGHRYNAHWQNGLNQAGFETLCNFFQTPDEDEFGEKTSVSVCVPNADADINIKTMHRHATIQANFVLDEARFSRNGTYGQQPAVETALLARQQKAIEQLSDSDLYDLECATRGSRV